jgi:hypothetical protein
MGEGGEMTQTLYACMNKWKKMAEKKKIVTFSSYLLKKNTNFPLVTTNNV